MTSSRCARPIRRETNEIYRGRKMCIEIGPDGVFVWPKGTRQRVMISLTGAYEKALANSAGIDTSPAKRQIGMSARKLTR